MRLFFITGFGEDENIFDHLHPLLPGEKEFISLWKVLPNKKVPALNVTLVAKDLVSRYGITSQDVVIGHSAGGWIALHIKQFVQCPIVQIASWTDGRKVVKPLPVNHRLLYFLANTPLFFNNAALRWQLKTNYQNNPSADIFRRIFIRLKEGNKENRVNQLRVIFNPVAEPISAQPDLRIHARKDPVVRFPDETTAEVPGDHFSLYTHPEAVATPIQQFLKPISKT
jgi:pimeloyl-ACP methyl ester carboxylesterase